MRLEAGTGKYELVLLKGIGGAAKTADSRVGAEESGCFMVPPLSPGEDGGGGASSSSCLEGKYCI